MNRLRSCDGCARHVFVSERVCPFCLTELAPAVERATVPIPSGASRAQRLALAAALGSTTLLACGEVREAEIAVPIYGAPLAGNQALPPSAAGAPATPDAGSTLPAAGRGGGVRDGGIASPVYGAPVYGAPLPVQPTPTPPPKQPDAAVPPDDDAGVPEPSGVGSGGRGGGMAVPIYGASPPRKD